MKRTHALGLVFALLVTTIASTASARDANGDGIVDGADLQIVRDAFYRYDARADLNGDGRVNFADLALLGAERDGLSRYAEPAATPSMTLLPATQDVPVLNEVTFELWMDFTQEPTFGGGTDIFYDPAALHFVSFEFDPGLGDDPAFRRVPDTDESGVLNALAFGNFGGLTGPALVGHLTMRAKALVGPTALTMAADAPDGPAGPFISRITFAPMVVDFVGAGVNVLEGPLPEIAISPADVSFGNVRLTQVEFRSITVSNVGAFGLFVGQAGAQDPLLPPFALEQDTCSLHTLPPGGSCVIVLSMSHPFAPGDFGDVFSISSQDPVTPIVHVGVTGQATADLLIQPAQLGEGVARCVNLATEQVLTRASNTGRLRCEGFGFEAAPNAPVALTSQGPARADGVAGGIFDGMTVGSVKCQNLTTGQSLEVPPLTTVRAWDCIAGGLVVTEGDSLRMTIRGVAD